MFFKYDGKAWQRIPPEEFPVEFKAINVAIGVRGYEGEELVSMGLVPAEKIKELNSDVRQPEFKTILREAVKSEMGCSEMIKVNDGWEGLGFFRLQASYEACLKYCDRKGVNQQNCPCNKLFKGAK